jgi:hypothetical protein
MFKLEKPKEISWPVTVNVPRDGGKVVKATFTGKFKMISSAEFNAIIANGGNDQDIGKAVVAGWGADFCDESENPLEFNDENLEMVLSIPYVRSGFIDAYLELSQGKEAKRKN